MANDTTHNITPEKNELVFPSLASNAFDISLFETFLPLVSGGTVMMLTNDDIKDVSVLIKRLKNASVVHAVPALMNQLLLQIEQEVDEDYSHITDLFVGGDKVPTAVLSSMRAVFPKAAIHVLYGPTESTIFVAVKSYFPGEENQFNGAVLGKPMPDVNVYILDEKLQLVPAGVKGEICIGGKRVAEGYLNREELSAKQFVENPFVEGERMYRTGDLGKWLRDGQIEFVGRSDDQVKVRGYRIELGEIESTLLKIDEIESAAARIWKNDSKENELTAYFSANRAFNASELRSALRNSLPDYMLPQSYVQMDELPVTHNGKVDYKALQNPTGISVSGGMEFVAPRTDLEEKIVQIWKGILKQEKVGVHDDFFHLGGHSLKALRLRNEYQKVLEVNLSLKELFTSTTIEDQARLIENENSEKFVQIEPAAEQENYPISDAQRRLWVLSQFESGSVAYNMPGTYPLGTNLDIDCFREAVNAVVERHEALRTVLISDKRGVRQRVLPSEKGLIESPIIDLRKGKSIQQFISEDTAVPFDMENGPLFRMYLLRVDDTEFVLYYNLHHIISDGWSMEVLVKDVSTFYTAFLNKKAQKAYELPEPLRIHYKDYSVWQLNLLETEAFADHKRFWTEQMNGELPILDFPGTNKRPRIKTYNGNLLSTYIDRDSGAKLKQFSEDQGGSLFIGLLAVWNLLCYKYTGQKDIIIGTPTANRDHSDLENQIGFYANTLALRNKLNPDWSFEELYTETKGNTLEAFDHQVYPFDRLIEELDLQHDTSRNAVFNVMLVLQNNQEKIEDLSEEDDTLLKERVKIINDDGASMSKFDLLINFREVESYLAFDLVFNTDIYKKSNMEQLMFHFKQLLTSVLEKPDSSVGTIDFLTESEKHLLLAGFNDTKTKYPKDKTITNLFEAQVDSTPSNIALRAGNDQITYRELNESANQLARYLSGKWELEPEELIGVNLKRGKDYALALLAILKLGGCAAPINNGLAKESLKEISQDFKGTVDENVFDEFKAVKDRYSSSNLNLAFSVENLAYIIYTSGSTGRPKGCMLEHRGIVNNLFSKIDLLSLTADSVIVHASKMCFVGGIWQLWAPLL
ncbi:MAG: condensation domain-containing protein, partial [Crocinitomicaceae bacterium]